MSNQSVSEPNRERSEDIADQRAPRALLEERVRKTQAAIAARGADALVVTSDAGRGWLPGYTTALFIAPFGVVVVTGQRAVFVAKSVDYADCQASVEHMDVVTTAPGSHDINERILQILIEDGVRAVLLEEDVTTAGDARRLRQACDPVGITVDLGPDVLLPLRSVKDAWEIAQMRQANRTNADVFDAIYERIRPGVTEYDLVVELEDLLRRRGSGSTRVSFAPIVASGPNSALPHASVSRRPLERGDLVMIDLGATWNGYCSDNTRTVVVGPAANWQRDLYAIVEEAQMAAIARIAPGAGAEMIHATAAEIIQAAGYGDHFPHGLGHGLGIDIPNRPMLAPNSVDILQPGHVTTVEPGVYLAGYGGVRIEDNVLVTADGYENLSTARKGLIEL